MKVKNSLDEILYEHIVESLINGDYEMGQNLTLDELAHRFEVSRTPVVQAVKLLANGRGTCAGAVYVRPWAVGRNRISPVESLQ